MNYFKDCTTIDEARKKYYELAKINHPDKGGNTATFQEILNQFEAFTPQTEKFEGEAAQWNSAEFAAIIDALIHLPGVEIEITGSYVRVAGDTKPVKDQIKAINNAGQFPTYSAAIWHRTFEHWFFKPSGYRPFTNRQFSLDEIRNLHGSQKVAKKQRQQVEE